MLGSGGRWGGDGGHLVPETRGAHRSSWLVCGGSRLRGTGGEPLVMVEQRKWIRGIQVVVARAPSREL